MSDYTYPLNIDLGDGLVMRSVTTEQEMQRVAAGNREAFQEQELEAFSLDVFTRYPGMRWEDILYVEDTANGTVASSICLLPDRWLYEDVELKVGELGIVGTHPDYRRRGLVRKQMAVFADKLEAGGYDLSNIQGIPYFYRQFGYDYALPLNTGCQLSLEQIPDPKADQPVLFQVRPMAASEVGEALALYESMAQGWCIKAARDEAIWRFTEELSAENPERAQSYLVVEGERPVGYIRLRTQLHHGRLSCREMTPMSYEATMAAFRFMKKRAPELGAASIDLDLSPEAPAMVVAKRLGAAERRSYAWQLRIPNRVRFLSVIAPVLERRLANSVMADLSGSLHLNFYVETVELRLEQGRVAEVLSLGRTDHGDVRLPPWPAVRLLTGYQSWEEIRAFRPDTGVSAEWQLVMDAMFPKRASFICSAL